MPNDSGPIYLETMMGRLPVEPWNTFSNLLFLALIVFWFLRVRGDVASHRFIAYSLPVLLIGWVGGTVYHGTRSSNVWLYLDFGPIALLVLAVAMFFWRRQGVAWVWLPVLVIGPIALVIGVTSLPDVPHSVRHLAGYPTLALSILLPVARFLWRTRGADVGLVVAALVAFGVAVTFRNLDRSMPISFLPMGMHWLWHSFGAVAVHLLIFYIWRGDLRDVPSCERGEPAMEVPR